MSTNIAVLPTSFGTPTLNQTSRRDQSPAAWNEAVSAALTRLSTTKSSSPPDQSRAGRAKPTTSQASLAMSRPQVPGAAAKPPSTPTSEPAPPAPEADIEAPDATLATQNEATASNASPDRSGQGLLSRSSHSPVPSDPADPTAPAAQAGTSPPVDPATSPKGKAEPNRNAQPQLQPELHLKPDLKSPAPATAGATSSEGTSRKTRLADTTSAPPAGPQPSLPVTPVAALTDTTPVTMKVTRRLATGASSAVGAPAGIAARSSLTQVAPSKGSPSDQIFPDIAPRSHSRITGPVNTGSVNPFLRIQGGTGATPSSSRIAFDTTPATPSQAGLANTVQELASTGGGTARVTLSPASLGNVVIGVLVSSHGHVSIRMTADSGQGQKALGDSISELTRHMTEAGFTLGAVQVVQQIHDGATSSFNSNTPGQGGYGGQTNGQMPGGSQQGRQQQGFSDAPVRFNSGATDGGSETTVATSGAKRPNDGISAYA